ncbi:N-acetyltransferase [Pelagibacterium sp. 26DY04]|uniref:GNAT family N-acetyltransferase n=1 Tax=Pelagibacterium sp. 26DY04 TaxID=2967130 RepID=UPI002814E829|nr:GNAT family N-acetyltransferase [Pelagibacterium sp. 26DY04]WMT86425.1 N-acetyltransferase [Pelagibacterium sp. 26DY04]
MDTELDIHYATKGDRGRYWADLAPGRQAEMTYRRRPDGSIVIDHTGVPKEFEGRGIALKLVKRAIKDARDGGFKIVPQCPYVAVQFRRHPDWSDLLA